MVNILYSSKAFALAKPKCCVSPHQKIDGRYYAINVLSIDVAVDTDSTDDLDARKRTVEASLQL